MISSVYDYYLSTYGQQLSSRHDSHKKSELRDTYNNIVKINKASPVYKVNTSESAQKLAIDIKEAARSIMDTLADITDAADGTTALSDVAVSDNPSLVSARYIGDGSNTEEMEFDVKQLAEPQVNTGNFLPTGARNLFASSYSFDIESAGVTYQIDFNVESNDTNGKVQNKLARLINNSDIGIKATTVTNDMGQKALKLTSENVGSRIGSPLQFNVIEQTTDSFTGIVDTLGLNRVTQYPANAVLSINGEEIVSESNSFSIDDTYEVKLNGISSEKGVAHVGVAKNTDPIRDELDTFTKKYNKLLDMSTRNDTYELRKLHRDITGVTAKYRDTLSESGIDVHDDYSISVNDEFFADNTDEAKAYQALDNIRNFKNELSGKVESMSMDPMQYVDKKIVAYKNPKRLISTPYAASAYAGMMFNGLV